METLLFFLAIGAIQLVASYMKQKKEREEATRKAQQRTQVPQYHEEPQEEELLPERSQPPPVESAPLPDPLREILRQFGAPEETVRPAPPSPPPPPVHPVEKVSEPADRSIHRYTAPQKPVENPFAAYKPGQAPAIPASNALGHAIEESSVDKMQPAETPLQTLVTTQDLRKGIIWAAILQEPRFRRPWNPVQR